MTRQMNMNEARLIEENQRWETHWIFLRDWVNENVDNNLALALAKGAVLKVMDSLRPEMVDDEQ